MIADSDSNYDGENSSSDGDSIPASTPLRRKSSNGATLRPTKTPQTSRGDAVPDPKKQLRRKRAIPESPSAAAGTRLKKRRLGQGGPPGGITGVDKGVVSDARVDHAVLQNINAFNRRTRGAKPRGVNRIEVLIPDSRSGSGAGSDWGPEKQLRRETEARQRHAPEVPENLTRASGVANPAIYDNPDIQPEKHEHDDEQDRESEVEVEAEVEAEVPSPERIPSRQRTPLPAEVYQTLRPAGYVRKGSSLGSIDFASPGRARNNRTTEPTKQTMRNAGPRVAKTPYGDRIARRPAVGDTAPTGRGTPRPQNPLETLQPRRLTVNGLSPPQPGSAFRQELQNGNPPSSAERNGGLIRPEADHDFLDSPNPAEKTLSGNGQASTVTLESKPLQQMIRLLGGPAWTALGQDWPAELYRPKPSGSSASPGYRAPCRTKLGRSCLMMLFHVWTRFSRAPKAPNFRAQARWFKAKDAKFEMACQSIDKLVDKTWQDNLAAIGDSDRRDNRNLELRRLLVKDLLEFLIPGLVGVLQAVFLLGGADDNEPDESALPEEGEFTEPVLSQLSVVLDWIAKLERALKQELEQRPLDASSGDESDGARERRAKKIRDGRQKLKAHRRSKRLQLGKYMTHFRRGLKEAFKELNETATRDERRQWARDHAEELAEAREKEEEAEKEEKQARWIALCRSTQQMRYAPDLSSERWRKALLAYQTEKKARLVWGRAGSSQPYVSKNTSMGPPTALPGRSRAALGGSERNQLAPTSNPAPRWRPWSDKESLFVLSRLRSRGALLNLAEVAEDLLRSVADVRQEVALLKSSWRSLAQERGIPPEPWAQA